MTGLSHRQVETLARPLRPSRIAKRQQGGKQLSYLEAWEVRAHLIRIFGYANFDIDLLDYHHVATREYMSKGDPDRNIDPKPMVEVLYAARVQLSLRGPEGFEIARYTDGAVGSASGPANMLGEHHDNALKTASSDAMKRCAMNLGNQFGLSLYDNGSTRDVVKDTLVKPPKPETSDEAEEPQNGDLSPEQAQAVAESLGAQIVGQEPAETSEGTPGPEGQHRGDAVSSPSTSEEPS